MNLAPAMRRARVVTVRQPKAAAGRYISIDDLKVHLLEDDFVKHCAMMLKVANAKRDDLVTEGVRRVIGCAIMTLAGDEALYTQKAEGQ